MGVDLDHFEHIKSALDNAQKSVLEANSGYGKSDDLRGQLRTTAYLRKVHLTAGDAKYKEFKAINLNFLTEADEAEALKQILKLLHGAIDDYTACDAIDQVNRLVKSVLNYSVRLGRLQANMCNYRSANVMLRQSLLLCSKYGLNTLAFQGNNQSSSAAISRAASLMSRTSSVISRSESVNSQGVFPEVQDALEFAQQIYDYSREVKDDSQRSLQHAQQRLLLEDYNAVLTACLVSQGLERDSVAVKGINMQDEDKVYVLVPPGFCAEDSKATFPTGEWTWTWVEHKTNGSWQEIVDKTISQLYQNVKSGLAEGFARDAEKALEWLTKFTLALELPNPGEALVRAVELAKRNNRALEALQEINRTAQGNPNLAWRLESMLNVSIQLCLDADDYKAHSNEATAPDNIESDSHQSKSGGSSRWSLVKMGAKATSTAKNKLQHATDPPKKVRFWLQKWQEAGKDALGQVVCYGLERLVTRAEVVQDDEKNIVSEQQQSAGIPTDESQVRIEAAQKLLDTARRLLEMLLDKYEGPESGKLALNALLRPLENALNAELEGKWEAIYRKQVFTNWCACSSSYLVLNNFCCRLNEIRS